VLVNGPYGGVVRPGRVDALRAIDSSARLRSWRTFGPRRLRRHPILLWLLVSVTCPVSHMWSRS
jgi:hypothetical protein